MDHKQYVAFLRGVNVKGTNMKMADVCAVFEKAGMKNVSSVLASGNIIFSSEKSPKDLKNILQTALGKHFDYEAFLFLLDRKAIEAIIDHLPFQNHPEFHLYAFIANKGVETTLIDAFEACEKTVGEMAKVVHHHFYWTVPKGATLQSQFGKILGKKSLKDQFTSRNLNTLEKVFKKMDA